MENEWIVVDRYSNEVWPCTTEEEANNTAEDILIDYWDSGDHEGVPEDVLHGAIVIAKVVAQSSFEVTDRKSDYDDADWPYDPSLDLVGELFMKRKEVEQCRKDTRSSGLILPLR
jgi:hypothetical protein